MQSGVLSVFDIFCFTVFITMSISFSVLNLLHLNISEDTGSMTLLFGSQIFLVITLLLAVISITVDVFNRNRLVEILKSINSFDKEVKSLLLL